MAAPTSSQRLRRLAEARRIAATAYAHRCCVVCGGEDAALLVLHLDGRSENNAPDNLAFACTAHATMFQAGLYPAAALRLMRDHWQAMHGTTGDAPRDGKPGTPMRRAAGKQAAAERRTRLFRRTSPRA